MLIKQLSDEIMRANKNANCFSPKLNDKYGLQR